MFYFQLKKKEKKNRDRDFSIISVGRERAIKQVFFLGLMDDEEKMVVVQCEEIKIFNDNKISVFPMSGLYLLKTN